MLSIAIGLEDFDGICQMPPIVTDQYVDGEEIIEENLGYQSAT